MRERITPMTAMMMNGAAWGAYGINFLIEIISNWFGIGLVLTIVFMVLVYASFVIWFLMKGVNVFSPVLIGNFAFGAAISAIPVVNLFYISLDKKTGIPTPGIRKNISRIIDIIQAEDKQYNEKQKAKKQPSAAATLAPEQQDALQKQQEKAARIREIRERQESERQARASESNAAETNMVESDNEDLYDRAA